MKTRIHQAFLNFIYPPLCLHCHQTTDPQNRYLCSSCFKSLEVLNPEHRCSFCFSELQSQNEKICKECRHQKRRLGRKAAPFELSGVAATLLSGLVNKRQPYLAKGAGAFLVMQWAQLNWDKPDFIVPIPRPTREKIQKGYDPNHLLASEVSELLQIPMEKILKFEEDETPPFRLKGEIADKIVLLIADKTTQIDQAAETLLAGHPKAIFGLGMCLEPI